MAKFFVRGLCRFRFLLVASLAMLLLSGPFLTEARSKEESSVNILDAPNLLAGMSSELTLQGDPNANLEVTIQKPDDSILILESVSNGQGKATLAISDYHLRQAGIYSISAREAGSKQSYAPSVEFEVYPGSVSQTRSQVDFSKNSAQVGETVRLTVSLLDNYGNEIDDHVLKVIPSSNQVSVTTSEFATDENGHMNFTLSSEKKGIYEFTIFDSSSNLTLDTKPKLAFSTTRSLAEIGGHDVVLAEESGPVNSFVVSGLEAPVVTGDTISLSVKAIDEQGFTVSDYTGSIRFSSSDTQATFPNDYTFLAEDQGEHSFSLAIKFLTPGTQSLIVTDLDRLNVTGAVKVEVLTEEDALDYSSEFETTDYEREGDFTLLNPSEGSYSSNTIDVEGEAEYGLSVLVYLNDEVAGFTEVEFDNSFTYTLQELEDGDYGLYVDVVEMDESLSEEEILELIENEETDEFTVIETSDLERITIDTTAPELVSISADPEGELSSGGTVNITVLSEADLEEASILFQEEVYELEETSTSGKYQTELVMPEEEGEYAIDVILMDALGNEVQYRDQLSLKAVASSTEEAASESEVLGVETVSGVTATGAEETVFLSWEEPESENLIAYYRVYYGPSKDSLYAVSETFDSSTHWSIPGLTGEEWYYFSVTAVDVEGNESEKSEAALGIPTLKKEMGGVDLILDTSPSPEISGAEDEVEETPQTGPEETALFLLSITGALIYMGIRKRAQRKSF